MSKIISFLPKVYSDEILYSLIGRYHAQGGNISLKDTMKDFFSTSNIIPTIEFQSHIQVFCNNLRRIQDTNAINILNSNTLYPIYCNFLSNEIRNDIFELMMWGKGGAIKYKTGMLAGGICKKQGIHYCPLCVKKEFKELGEAYIHRTHQVEGVLVCELHGCCLKKYSVFKKIQEFIVLDKNNVDFKETYFKEKISSDLCKLAKDVYYILNSNISKYSIDNIDKLYKKILYNKGFSSVTGRVFQLNLEEEFINYYGRETLELLESFNLNNNEHSWLRKITRKFRSSIHPIRHLLFIGFLCGGMVGFVKELDEIDSEKRKEKWPCLNIACEYYNQEVIEEYKITKDYKSKKYIGTFECICGFIYARDLEKQKNFIGKVIKYGEVWERKLKSLIVSESSIRAIASQMKCDSTTVVKYSEKLNLKCMLNTQRQNLFKDKTDSKQEVKTIYRKKIMDMLVIDSNINRSKLRSVLRKEYLWLYKNDKDFIDQHIPLIKYNKKSVRDYTKYWMDKDDEVLLLCITAYESLINETKPVRITRSLIGRKINKLALIQRKIDKLKSTKEYLDKICESIEEFKQRKM
ncbi:MAG: TnsD family Tn7-like transposition protein [Peptostreptococcaceae bacterium]